jgi:8-oxo-dGTP pyrophosphatase MutT (NUDIX family)
VGVCAAGVVIELETKSWNVVFLLDRILPARVLLLKRSADKHFAPNLYTGIGGKLEPGETPLESAVRELAEETGLLDLSLTEFARVKIQPDYWLYYFYGIFRGEIPPTQDGILEWVETSQIFDREIIPTTRRMLEEWGRRGFRLDRPFTVVLAEAEPVNGIRPAVITAVLEGLDVIE